MKNVLYGCQCAFWFVMVFVAIEGHTFLRMQEAHTEQISAGAYQLTLAGAGAAKEGKTELHQQRVMVNAFVDQAYTQLFGRKANKKRAAVVGLLPSLAESVKSVNTSAASLNTLVLDTNTSLNGKSGVLPKLAETLGEVQKQVTLLSTSGKKSLDESTTAMQSLSSLLADPNLPKTLANIEHGTNAFANAGTTVEQILFDLRHPEKPGKFVRAVQIMLQILGATSRMGQSAWVAGK